MDKYLAKTVEDANGSLCTRHAAQIIVLGVIDPYGKKMPP